MSQAPADRRKHRRLVAQIPARFGVEGRICNGNIVDLSEGGLQLRSAESFAAGAVLDVFVQFPRRRVRVRARVAWVRGEPPTMGLMFVQQDRSLMAAYDQWIAELQAAGAMPPEAPANAGEAATAPTRQAMPAPRAAPAAPAAEPAGDVVRRLETARGNQFEAHMRKTGSGWRLFIYEGSSATGSVPEFDRACPDFATAEAVLREFLKTR
jgi:PilZ domain-containing protein